MPLSACGFGDVRAPLPEFMRAKAPDPVPPEAPPDIKRLMRENLEQVFTAASQPQRVRVSTPPSCDRFVPRPRLTSGRS